MQTQKMTLLKSLAKNVKKTWYLSSYIYEKGMILWDCTQIFKIRYYSKRKLKITWSGVSDTVSASPIRKSETLERNRK